MSVQFSVFPSLSLTFSVCCLENINVRDVLSTFVSTERTEGSWLLDGSGVWGLPSPAIHKQITLVDVSTFKECRTPRQPPPPVPSGMPWATSASWIETSISGCRKSPTDTRLVMVASDRWLHKVTGSQGETRGSKGRQTIGLAAESYGSRWSCQLQHPCDYKAKPLSTTVKKH